MRDHLFGAYSRLKYSGPLLFVSLLLLSFGACKESDTSANGDESPSNMHVPAQSKPVVRREPANGEKLDPAAEKESVEVMLPTDVQEQLVAFYEVMKGDELEGMRLIRKMVAEDPRNPLIQNFANAIVMGGDNYLLRKEAFLLLKGHLRNSVLNFLVRDLARDDALSDAVDLVSSLSSGTVKNRSLSTLGREMALLDFSSAIEFAVGLELPEEKRAAIEGVVSGLEKHGLEQSSPIWSVWEETDDVDLRAALAPRLVREMFADDFATALEWMEAQSFNVESTEMELWRSIPSTAKVFGPQEALTLVTTVKGQDLGTTSVVSGSIERFTSTSDYESALYFILFLSEDADRRVAAQTLGRIAGSQSDRLAQKIGKSIEDNETRGWYLEALEK